MRRQKIVLATGVYPPQIGGPAKYVKNIRDELLKEGFNVKVASYFFEHKLPPIVRHVWYFFKLLFISFNTKVIFAFDTLSTGVPAVLVGKILRKKVVVRIGGDFLWETHIEATGEKTPLPLIYENKNTWILRDKVIFYLTNFLFKTDNYFVFNSEWLMNIFLKNYNIDRKKVVILKNVFSPGKESEKAVRKNFLWAGRPIKIKNINSFSVAFEEAKKQNPEIYLDIFTDLPHHELMKKIEKCFALVLPSYSDVSPNFIIEGIERGKPFVCTKYTSLVTDFPNCGIFIDHLDKENMKNSVLTLAEESVYREKSEATRLYTEERTFEDITNEFLTIAG